MTTTPREHWGRRVTPVSSIINTLMTGGGFALLIWMAIHFVEGFETRMDKFEEKADNRNKLIFQKIIDIDTREYKDITCLSKALYRCCGSKADVTC